MRVTNPECAGGGTLKRKMDTGQKDCYNDGQNNLLPANGDSDEFSRTWMGQSGTKRQTYHIYVELIAKLRGYAYWERRKISEVVNCALDQFFSDKEVKARPAIDTLSKKKMLIRGSMYG